MDQIKESLSVVRREEEENARQANAEANDYQDNAELPGSNEAADRAQQHQENADNLADVGADHGY
ncbi:hypothetical protein VMCG_01827 [Cytospora schulzeri]|uniref:Uncharacterized protein n=1 Tax=Cytospora schulzeri TaxID=448051 RepID=A0A423X3M2_9PEZI|nr:hypothetical protein VMCG_01827 [Valsa malicola]